MKRTASSVIIVIIIIISVAPLRRVRNERWRHRVAHSAGRGPYPRSISLATPPEGVGGKGVLEHTNNIAGIGPQYELRWRGQSRHKLGHLGRLLAVG